MVKDVARAFLGSVRRCESLAVRHEDGSATLPFCCDQADLEIIHIAQCIKEGAVEVLEIGAGSVPEVEVISKAGHPVFIPAGTVLLGGKQNRICAIATLVMPGERRRIDVSCVQHGRWSQGRKFAGTTSAPLSVKSRKLGRERRFRDARRPRNEDQHEVWRDVDEVLARKGVRSATRDLTDHKDDRVAADPAWGREVTAVGYQDRMGRWAGAELYGVPGLVNAGVSDALMSGTLEFGKAEATFRPSAEPVSWGEPRVTRLWERGLLSFVDFDLSSGLVGTAVVFSGVVIQVQITRQDDQC